MERMEGEQFTKRADALRLEGRRRKGRSILRWEDRVKRDFAGVGREWRMRARDGGGVEMSGGNGSETGSVTKEGKQTKNDQYRCQPHPRIQGERGEQQQLTQPPQTVSGSS